MSVYPVRLAEWYPKKPDKGQKGYPNVKEQKYLHDTMRMMVNDKDCIKCGRKKIDWRVAYGHHSLPWGYGDVWCTKRCYRTK